MKNKWQHKSKNEYNFVLCLTMSLLQFNNSHLWYHWFVLDYESIDLKLEIKIEFRGCVFLCVFFIIDLEREPWVQSKKNSSLFWDRNKRNMAIVKREKIEKEGETH